MCSSEQNDLVKCIYVWNSTCRVAKRCSDGSVLEKMVNNVFQNILYDDLENTSDFKPGKTLRFLFMIVFVYFAKRCMGRNICNMKLKKKNLMWPRHGFIYVSSIKSFTNKIQQWRTNTYVPTMKTFSIHIKNLYGNFCLSIFRM